MRAQPALRQTPAMDADGMQPARDSEVGEHVALARRHTLVLLMTGPRRDHSDDEAERIQQAHLRHLVGLHKRGELVVNGPVLDATSSVRGISVYRTDDLDLVRAWVDADPAVAAGRLTATVLPWFGTLPGEDQARSEGAGR